MDRWTRLLGVVLGVQILLVAGTWLGGSARQAVGPREEPVLSWAPEEVTEVTIEGDTGSVTLKRGDEGWVIARLNDLPAAGERIEDLLRSLHASRLGPAVGTTPSALKRFRVADEAYERRLRLRNQAGQAQVVYVGESAGPGRAYVRVQGQGTAHELGIRRYELGTRARDWAKKDLLHVDAGTLERLEIGDLTLVAEDGGWTLADLEEGEKPDPDKVRRLIDRVTTINFSDVVPEKQARKGELLLTVRMRPKTGEPVVHRVYTRRPPQGEDEPKEPKEYVLDSVGRPWVFLVPGYAVAPLVEADRQSLLKHAAEPAPTPLAGAAAPEGDGAPAGDEAPAGNEND